jgi:O-antigen/teichoic acid export membrane protein
MPVVTTPDSNTPSLARRVGTGMAWGQGGRVAEVGLTLGIAVLVVRGLNPDGFGAYSLLTNLAGAASVFIPIVTMESLGAFLPRITVRGKRLFIALLVALLRVGVILVVSLAALAVWNDVTAAIGLDGVKSNVGLLAAAYWASQDLLNSATGYFATDLDVRPVALWRVFGIGCTFVAVVVLAVTNDFTVGRVLAAVSGGYLIAVAGLALQALRRARPVPPERNELRAALSLTRSTWVIGILGFTLATQIDVLLIGALTGQPSGAAYYAAAVGVVGRAQLLLLSGWFAIVIPAFGHALHAGSLAQLRSAWRRAAQLVLLVALPINTLLLVNAHSLMVEMFGVTYAPAGRLLEWVCVFNLVLTLLVNPICVAALWALDAQRALARFRIGTAALNLALAFPLIQLYGAMGAVLATGAAAVAGGLIEYELARRRGSTHYPYRLAVAAAIASCLAAAPSLALGSSHKPGLALAFVVGAAVYVGVLLFVKPLRADDIAAAAAIHPRLDNRVLRAFAPRRPA